MAKSAIITAAKPPRPATPATAPEQPAAKPASPPADRSIGTYRAKRDFTRTAEPAPTDLPATTGPLIFVVQKHDATRLHYDFRLEHGGVLWSWAIPRGPSLDPHDKRLAVHVEDHPRDYATFAGTIPAGNYGAGTVEIWDRGTWAPLGDAAADLARGELKFILEGERLHGKFVLIRLKPRPKERAENWLLIKEHDEHEQAGVDATILEKTPLTQPKPTSAPAPARSTAKPASHKSAASKAPRTPDATTKPATPPPATPPPSSPPCPGATQAPLPDTQAPQLATLADAAPTTGDWISEVKFDGYRLLAWVRGGAVTLLTRNGQDWTHRLTRVAQAVGRMQLADALLDGELVALRDDGVSSFARLQAALTAGRDRDLFYYLFDLVHLDGWDLRASPLRERKRLLAGLASGRGAIRYSDHIDAEGSRMHRSACSMGLEGIICKQADAPYKAGRAQSWLKVKCQGREEFVVLGWTDPEGTRRGFGSLHMGFYDPAGQLHYAGGVGTGFSSRDLTKIRARLDALEPGLPPSLLYAGETPERGIHWVAPQLVAEVQFIGWSGAGRLRHAAYLGLREDKVAAEVVRDIPDPEEVRLDLSARGKAPRIVQTTRTRAANQPAAAISPPPPPSPSPPSRPRTITAAKPARGADLFEGVRLTHPEKPLWPGITKLDLAEYWRAVCEHAVSEIARRPLAFVRCPEGIGGEHFFQKHTGRGIAASIHGGDADGAPYLSIDGVGGLYAATQMSAIELHTWGSSLADPLHADRLVFDLDPGDGVTMPTIVAAAQDIRARLTRLKLASWCRTSGGKGLHVVVPLTPRADWTTTRAWCRAFAETMEREAPDRYVASVAKKKRTGRILIDWLRNGLGSTAVASFCPRAREGAGVATPLDWNEVDAKLDPGKFTLKTVPARLKNLKSDPWDGFHDCQQTMPERTK